MPDFAKALRQLRPPEPPQRHLFQAESPAISLSHQLQFLKAGFGGRSVDTSYVPAVLLPEGHEESTAFGTHYVIRNVYEPGHYHGKVELSRFSCADLQGLMTLMREKGTVPERDAIVFLDTETTGIQGGTGMCPFLVGLGYYVRDDFHMVQYFIRDFDEEPSMLTAIGQLLERFTLVVTYNGASFDIPLLETRFTLARLDNPFSGMSHLDLLTSARRLWRNGHGSCRLVALEHKIVSFLRGPDVPGSMIPRAYFDYLQGRSSSILGGVFIHNVHDVVSLAALTVCACDRMTTEPAALDDPLDVYSLARIFENTSDWRRAVRFYEMALSGGLPELVRHKAEESLAVIYRRVGEHERAIAICKELIDGSIFSMVGYAGAAIHYERVADDPVRALEIVEQGISRLPEDEDGPETRRWRAALEARRERLRQKAIQWV